MKPYIEFDNNWSTWGYPRLFSVMIWTDKFGKTRETWLNIELFGFAVEVGVRTQ